MKTRKRINVEYNVWWTNCDKCYIVQTGRKVATRMDEHKLATRTQGPVSLITAQED